MVQPQIRTKSVVGQFSGEASKWRTIGSQSSKCTNCTTVRVLYDEKEENNQDKLWLQMPEQRKLTTEACSHDLTSSRTNRGSIKSITKQLAYWTWHQRILKDRHGDRERNKNAHTKGTKTGRARHKERHKDRHKDSHRERKGSVKALTCSVLMVSTDGQCWCSVLMLSADA